MFLHQNLPNILVLVSYKKMLDALQKVPTIMAAQRSAAQRSQDKFYIK
jgi:hypothetical protein